MTDINQPKRPTPSRMLFAALLTTTVLAGGAVAMRTVSATAADTSAPIVSTAMSGGQPGFGDLVAKVKPAVVNIATVGPAEHVAAQDMPDSQFGPEFGDLFRRFGPNMPGGQSPRGMPGHRGQSENGMKQHALGSGFIVDADGYVVTNNHVVDGATKITVTLPDGSTYPATVKGRDEKTDVALLKIDSDKKFPFVTFGDSDKAREGDWVIAVGNPYGLGGTVTAGIVSAHGRDINEGPYDDFLQIDAPINPGNSGGPLFDQSGRVIGIDTAIYSPTGGSVGIGFAVPSSIASKVVDQLREHGSVERGWLGVQMQPITPTLAKAMGLPSRDGVLVDKVEPGSPAADADFHQGDVVTAINGKPVKGPREMAMDVAGLEKSANAKMTIWREGHERTLDVKIGAPPRERTASADEAQPENPIGLALAPMSDDMRSQLGLDDKAKGVVVTGITPDSRAADSGLRAGDVIVRIGNDAVTTPSEVANRLHADEKAKKDAVPLLVMRDGTTYYLALQLKAA